MKNRDIYWRRYKKHCTQDNYASISFKEETLGPHTILLITSSYPIVFFWISLMVLHLFSFKGNFGLGKSQKFQVTKFGLWGGWVTSVIWCFIKKFCTRHDSWAGVLLWWSCQSPVAHSCGLLSHPKSFPGGMFKLNTKFDAVLLLYVFSCFECDGHSVYVLTQWCPPPPLTSTVKSS